MFSCKPTRFLPAKSCFAFSTAQQLPADARVCHLPLFLSLPSPSTPMAYNFGRYCYILIRIYFSICVRESPLTPNYLPSSHQQLPSNFHCHQRQALPLFLLREGRKRCGALPATPHRKFEVQFPLLQLLLASSFIPSSIVRFYVFTALLMKFQVHFEPNFYRQIEKGGGGKELLLFPSFSFLISMSS